MKNHRILPKLWLILSGFHIAAFSLPVIICSSIFPRNYIDSKAVSKRLFKRGRYYGYGRILGYIAFLMVIAAFPVFAFSLMGMLLFGVTLLHVIMKAAESDQRDKSNKP